MFKAGDSCTVRIKYSYLFIFSFILLIVMTHNNDVISIGKNSFLIGLDLIQLMLYPFYLPPGFRGRLYPNRRRTQTDLDYPGSPEPSTFVWPWSKTNLAYLKSFYLLQQQTFNLIHPVWTRSPIWLVRWVLTLIGPFSPVPNHSCYFNTIAVHTLKIATGIKFILQL